MFTRTSRPELRRRARDGFALPAAMFSLVIIGVLVTGGFYLARQESRISVASHNGNLAFYLAERGINETLAEWNAQAYGALPPWTDTIVGDTVDQGFWQVRITPTTGRNYYITSTGTVTRGGQVLSGASRTMGLMGKLRSADITPPAALTTQGSVSVRGGALVTGMDTNPPGWGFCPTSSEQKPGVLTTPGSSVTTSGGGQVQGFPVASATDASIADSTFTQFGDISWADLTALADITVPGGNFNGTAPSTTPDGRCNISDNNNWGDPLNPAGPCGMYFPIIHVTGSARIQSAGVGQGILLVDGDLDLRGSFVFHGIIISQGAFMTQGSGHRIMGGVLARNADLELEKLVGASIVQNSSCAIDRALNLNSSLTYVKPISERSWVDLSNMIN